MLFRLILEESQVNRRCEAMNVAVVRMQSASYPDSTQHGSDKVEEQRYVGRGGGGGGGGSGSRILDSILEIDTRNRLVGPPFSHR